MQPPDEDIDSNMTAINRPDAHDDALTPGQRDHSGRFGAGNRFGRGRPRSSITSALRRQTDPERVASFLIGIMEDPKAPIRERVRCAELITDRLEGKAVTRALHLSATASAILPPGFAALPPDVQERVLADQRAAAIAGTLTSGDGENE